MPGAVPVGRQHYSACALALTDHTCYILGCKEGQIGEQHEKRISALSLAPTVFPPQADCSIPAGSATEQIQREAIELALLLANNSYTIDHAGCM